MAALIKNDLAQIGINVNIVAAGPGHLRRQERHRRRSSGISPAAACAATSTATWPSSTRSSPSARPCTRSGSPAISAPSEPEADVAARRQRADHARHQEAAADVPEAQHGPDRRAARDPARLGLEVPGRQHEAEEHLRRVHRLQPRRCARRTSSASERTAERWAGVTRPRRSRSRSACTASSPTDSSLSVATLVAVSIVIFVMVRLLPGNIIDLFFARRRHRDAGAARGGEEAARPRPAPTPSSTGTGSSGVFHGDFGNSLLTSQPVTEIIASCAADRHRAGLPRPPDRALDRHPARRASRPSGATARRDYFSRSPA